MNPGSPLSGTLRYTGTLAGGGTITANGLPITMIESSGADIRALYVRRKDFASAGLTYETEFSETLTSWARGTVPPTVLADDGTCLIVSESYPSLVGGSPRHFVRVRVTLAP